LEWKLNADDIESPFQSDSQTASIEQIIKNFLNHLLRCKNESSIKDVKLFKKQTDLFVKGKCVGFRKNCNINLLNDDICSDNSLIDEFVNQQLFALSSAFDLEIDLSVSFNFDTDNIGVVPGFLSEVIGGTSASQRVSNVFPDITSNNEAHLTINKKVINNKIQSEATFQQSTTGFTGLFGLSSEEFTFAELTQFDDPNKDTLNDETTRIKCSENCADEKSSVESIFSYYGLDFDTNVDVCYWDEINCLDGSVTQIFIREYKTTIIDIGIVENGRSDTFDYQIVFCTENKTIISRTIANDFASLLNLKGIYLGKFITISREN